MRYKRFFSHFIFSYFTFSHSFFFFLFAFIVAAVWAFALSPLSLSSSSPWIFYVFILCSSSWVGIHNKISNQILYFFIILCARGSDLYFYVCARLLFVFHISIGGEREQKRERERSGKILDYSKRASSSGKYIFRGAFFLLSPSCTHTSADAWKIQECFSILSISVHKHDDGEEKTRHDAKKVLLFTADFKRLVVWELGQGDNRALPHLASSIIEKMCRPYQQFHLTRKCLTRYITFECDNFNILTCTNSKKLWNSESFTDITHNLSPRDRAIIVSQCFLRKSWLFSSPSSRRPPDKIMIEWFHIQNIYEYEIECSGRINSNFLFSLIRNKKNWNFVSTPFHT